MGQYQELCSLTTTGIKPRLLADAAHYLGQGHDQEPEPSRSFDTALLLAGMRDDDPLPLLCLRCRISHALEAWLSATHRANKDRYGLELLAMASYALDDEEKLTLRIGPDELKPFAHSQLALLPKGMSTPFSAEILRSYDSALCGLPHWARLKIQAHNELKAYFRQHGLLLISDWALLRNSSPSRVRQACQEQLRTNDTVVSLSALHSRYGPLYDAAKRDYKTRTGKSSGWQPDPAFLRELAPDQDPFATTERLKAIAKAVRLLLTGSSNQSLDQAAEVGFEPVDPSSQANSDDDVGPSSGELKALISDALQRAMDQLMPDVLAASGKNAELLRCLWAGWAEGLTNRPLAERCGTTCGTVSKKLRPTEHATMIATAAAQELKRHQAFAAVSQSVEGAERLVAALRNHLLEPEREGDVAPLRRWIQQYLNQP